ncbi:MAG: ribbon-helix-helix domain-containing protein [Acidimicrobiales bacterium]
MTKQLTVRLPDDLVQFIDETVASGLAPSRAAVVTDAVERARRREIVERDAAILASIETQDDDDVTDLAEFAARAPLDDLG